ncbi:hypothetical protein [Symbiopectobacterium sp.]|uniref:hypothetical protein n=1 Tax=Symbiopectobacterium sp. TaxID=2952789 RepID=UPI003F686AE5
MWRNPSASHWVKSAAPDWYNLSSALLAAGLISVTMLSVKAAGRYVNTKPSSST